MSTPRSDELFGHPKGLYVCFFTEMWERFSFYGMKALLFLYLTQHHLFGDHISYDVIGAYGGLVYCVPVLGGLLADRYLGMRKAVIFGAILLVLGHIGMGVEGDAAHQGAGGVVRDQFSLMVFYGSLALIIMGVGFLKPNISTIVGKLYPVGDARRDSGFSLFYAGINLGALFASLICGYLGQAFGWSYGFGAAGVGMLLGLGMFLWGQKYLNGHAEAHDPALLEQRVWGLRRETLIYVSSSLGVIPVAALMWATANRAFSLGEHLTLAMLLMLVVAAVVAIWFVYFLIKRCSSVQRRQMLSLMSLIMLCLIFFTLYEQTYGSWVAFSDRLMTKNFFPSLVSAEKTIPWSIFSLLLAPGAFILACVLTERGASARTATVIFAASITLLMVLLTRDLLVVEQTAGSLTFLGAFAIVCLSPIFTGLWAALDRRGMDPSKPVKSALGLIFAGLSFLPLIWAAQHAGATGAMASVWYLVAAYFLLEIGEMCLAPAGLSAVTELSVPSVVSLMMGTWFLATAFSEVLAASFGKLAAIEIAPGAALDFASASQLYGGLFEKLMWIGLLAGVITLLFSPLIRRGMRAA